MSDGCHLFRGTSSISSACNLCLFSSLVTIMVSCTSIPMCIHYQLYKSHRIILTASFLCIAASQMAQQISQMNPGAAGANLFQPGQDPDKMFQSEAENLEVLEHWYILDGIDDRLLKGS